MQTTRRLYLYAISWISLAAVLWGSIRFIRSAMNGEWEHSANRLAGDLSLVLVSLLVFLIHWSLAQRSAAQSPRERASRARIKFLYGILLATLLPAISSTIALLSHFFYPRASQASEWSLLLGDQTPADISIAIFLNLLAAGYFYIILRSDRRSLEPDETFTQAHGLYMAFWLAFGLGLAVLSVQQILQYGLERLALNQQGEKFLLANGLASFLAGVPLWIYGSRRRPAVMSDSGDESTPIILIAGTILVLLAASMALISAGLILRSLLHALLSSESNPFGLLAEISLPISVALPLGLVWLYFGRAILERLQSVPGSSLHTTLRRIYLFGFAFLGLAAAFSGLQILLRSIVDAIPAGVSGWDEAGRLRVAGALAGLLVGLPLWIFAWRRAVAEVKERGEAGERARRSRVRKAYLYGVLFLGAIGGMFAMAELLFAILRASFGSPSGSQLRELAYPLMDVLLFAPLLGYYFYLYREDARLTERSLRKRYSLYPVLVLDPELDNFAARMVEVLEVEAPGLPVAVHSIRAGAPDESLSAAKAVILPSEMAIRPPESLRLWLQAYPGIHLVVNTPLKDWHWIAGSRKSLPGLAERTARVVRKLAEGEKI